jgi:tetratricopeptide (TPR) repeat protein
VEEHAKASEYDQKSALMFSQSGESIQASHTFLESAEYAYASGDYKTAADSYIKAAEFDERTKDDTKASDNYMKAAKSFEQAGDVSKAIEYYSLALGLFDKIKAYEKAAQAYENIGRCNEKIGNIEGAIGSYKKAGKLNESERNLSGAIANFMYAGKCFESLGRVDEAIAYYNKAADIADKSKDGTSKGMALANVGRCHESAKKYDNAVTNYINSGDAYIAANKRKEAVKVLENALDISLMQAKENEASGDFEKASGNYKNASYCYYQLKDYEQAADLFYKHAQSMEKAGKREDADEAYTQAGEAYAKSGLFYKAGDSFMRASKFEEAASHFLQHAQKASAGKMYFDAGKSYDLAAGCERKMGRKKEEKDAMNSSIWQYVAYLDLKKEQPEPAKEAEANLRIGEGYLKVEDTRRAMKSMLKARELYEKLGDQNMRTVADAQVELIDAKESLKATDYAKATEHLKKSLDALGRIVLDDIGEFDRIYLSERREDAEKYLSEIESRPDVEVEVTQPSDALVRTEITLAGRIVNKGTQTVQRIVILPNTPQTVEIRKAAKECLKLDGKETFSVDVLIYPTEVGSFVFRPLEILYHDAEDRKYMKSSNEIKLTIVAEKKEVVFEAETKELDDASAIRVSDRILRGFIGVEPTSVVLVSYNPGDHTHVVANIMDILVNERKEGGVYISVSKPYQQILKTVEGRLTSTENLKFIDCISRASGRTVEKTENVVYVENPASLEEISMYSDKLMREVPAQKKFLLIDSLSSLLIYNEERAIEELMHFLVNQIRSDGIGGVILSADEASTQKIVKRLIPTCDREIKV